MRPQYLYVRPSAVMNGLIKALTIIITVYILGYIAVRFTHSYRSHTDIDGNYSISTLYKKNSDIDVILYYGYRPLQIVDIMLTDRNSELDWW